MRPVLLLKDSEKSTIESERDGEYTWRKRRIEKPKKKKKKNTDFDRIFARYERSQRTFPSTLNQVNITKIVYYRESLRWRNSGREIEKTREHRQIRIGAVFK
jgi:hypothetical protein